MAEHTFVICAYKESPYLEACMRSLTTQESVKSGRSEVILFTSTPNTFISGLCTNYKIPEFTGKSRGIGANWNEALSKVKTRYATIAHQDDIYKPAYGEVVLEAFKKNPQLNLVFTDYSELDNKGNQRPRNLNLKIKTLGNHLWALSHNKTWQRRVYAFGNFIMIPTLAYDLERLKDVHYNEDMKMALDWEYLERVMKLPGQIQYIRDRLYYHRIHAGSETTVNTENKHRESEERAMFEKYWGKGMAKALMILYKYNQKANDV